MTGFIITVVCLVAFILWMRYEIKHAPVMPDDFDARTRDEKILEEIANDKKQLTKTQPAK